MLEFIEKCQRLFCAYDTYGHMEDAKRPSMCDCKFGATKIGCGSETGNGCPEMRCVKEIFDNMTDKEFDRIVNRMNKKRKKVALTNAIDFFNLVELKK
jgi:hypothetical protein